MLMRAAAILRRKTEKETDLRNELNCNGKRWQVKKWQGAFA